MPTKLTPDIPPGTFNECGRMRRRRCRETIWTRCGVPTRRRRTSSERAGDGVQLGREEPGQPAAEAGRAMRPGKKKRTMRSTRPPKETSKEDISVGKYYLDNKNWKAALSRFQSALVLAPDEPEVYWGLAESDAAPGKFCGCAGELPEGD